MTETIEAADYAALAKKPAKYGNKRPEKYGITWDSQAELDRYEDLLLMEKAGEITHLVRQPRYELKVGATRIGRYQGDFEYHDVRTNTFIVEDVKGFKTATYRMKKKLMLALWGIDITEIEA